MEAWWFIKKLLKYLRINKRDGVKKSELLLRHPYVSLAVQGQTAQQWADSMQQHDTPGDEIALHVLCKMYNQHCCVFTSANIWTTIENKHHGFTEDEMLEKCDIKLLFIEPGVFGVLKSRPAMPPPPLHPAQFESATDILPEPHSSDENGHQPLNLKVLSEPETLVTVVTIGNNENPVPAHSSATGDSSSTITTPDATVDNKDVHIEQRESTANANTEITPPGDVNPIIANKKETGISVFKLSNPLGFDMEKLNCVVKLIPIEDVIKDESFNSGVFRRKLPTISMNAMQMCQLEPHVLLKRE